MDPNATIRIIRDRNAEHQYEECEERDQAFHDLSDWLINGGFRPRCAHLGIVPTEIGGNGFDGPRRASTTRETYISGPDGMCLRKWGKHFAFKDASGTVHHLARS